MGHAPHSRSMTQKIQFGTPEVTLGLLPGASGVTKMTRHARACWARSRFSSKANCSAHARRVELGLVHELVSDASQEFADAGARVDRSAPKRPCRSTVHPWDAQGLPHSRRHAACQPDRSPPRLSGGAGNAQKAKTRGLYPAPAGDSGVRWWKARWSTYDTALRHGKPLPGQDSWSAQNAKNDDQYVLLQPEFAIKLRPVKRPGSSFAEASSQLESGHSRRRHDGCRHRVCAGAVARRGHAC